MKLNLKSIIILLAGLCTLFAGRSQLFAEETASLLKPVDLQCEMLQNPLGIDVLSPRLSWRLNSLKPGQSGQAQTAWRILVSDQDKFPLDFNQADSASFIWDSGWIESAKSQQIAYQGKPLESDKTYYWQVQIRDEQGKFSQPSETAFWSTGILNEDQWKGQWIGSGQSLSSEASDKRECDVDDPWFRKTFKLADKPTRAMLFVASIGFHEVYVNGKRIGDAVLSPNVTDHSKRARYITYDITGELQQGENVIAFWLGSSWSLFPWYQTDDKPQAPIVLAQTNIELADQSSVMIQTDESWKTASSPSKLTGTWRSGSYGGEHWDANKEVPNWNLIDFDDSSWKNAVTYSPKLTVSAQMSHPNRIQNIILPNSVQEVSPGVWRIDMGVNFAGWLEIPVEGKPGDTIEFHYSEAEQHETTFNLYSRYTLNQTGKGVFKNRFNYHSGRWVTIHGLTTAPNLAEIKGYHLRTDFAPAATFICSNKTENWVYNTVCWTYENLSIGGYIVDCPQRERLGYGGDAHATSETGIFNYHLADFYYKWMQDWRDTQGTGAIGLDGHFPGALPNTAPTYDGGGGPAWGGICITLPWSLYQQYGDIRCLEDNFQMIIDWLDFLEDHTKDGLLEQYGAIWTFLGDWLWPGAPGTPNSDDPEVLCFNNCYRVFNLITAAKIARVIGRNDMAEIWEKRAEISRKAINEKYFDASDNSYFGANPTIMSTALLANIPPEGTWDKVMKRLEDEIMINRTGHICAGITGGSMLFRLLRQERKDEILYSMTSKTDYPSWGFMRDSGATTIWEAWEKDKPGHSLLHSSFLFPGAWYIDSVLGIRPDVAANAKEPGIGFQKFLIQPPKLNATPLTFARGHFDSPYGRIVSDWRKVTDESGNVTTFILNATIPPNTTATVYVPSESGLVSVTTAEPLEELSPLFDNKPLDIPSDKVDGYVIFHLPSGSYTLQSHDRIDYQKIPCGSLKP
ncbi:MAG: family 78 glycoside hydrolase catalytic domain [Thermoguttaceae bacterium]|nr:family 78 glycoside hydrolase catalytic domain [Thermoguttaceae bacterium]